LRTALCPFAIVLIGSLMAYTALAAEGSSGSRGEGKGSAAPAQAGGDRSSAGGGKEGAKGDSHPSRGDDNKGEKSGASDRGETPKDTGPSAPAAKDSSSVEPSFEPSRRLDKSKNRLGGDNATVKPNLSRRLSPRPQPQPPNIIRNAIGVTLPARENAERRDVAHPSPAAPQAPPAAPSAIPGGAAARLGATEKTNHPIPSPVVAPPAAGRGAINGTSMTRRSVGPPRIGGPTASAAGVNGTTIRPKR
jgi:hypothetical protein